jgi:hypothetical protein
VARVIATVGGIALKPGVSLNRRLYTAPMIASAVARAQERVRTGTAPMVMLTHHGAEDDSRQIAASLTGWSLDEDGNARFTAGLTDTAAGRDIAALADTSDGSPPHLKGTSIRGYWTGTVRKVKGPDGRPVETADGLELDGLDYTRSPGVGGAEVDTFAWADRTGRSETTERVLIFESVPEAHVTAISEETTPAAEADPAPVVVPETLAEGLAAVHPGAHILENGICLTCPALAEAGTPMSKRTSGTQGPGGPYADPGYQPDKKQRYQLDTKAHAKAAWAYISQAKNAKAYTAQQLKRIKGKIKGALKRFGVTVSAESAGWTVDAPVYVTEALAEYFGDPSCCGSWSISASNGPTNICLSAYGMDPDELDPILRAAADAACMALARLDPDMDGDTDVPGAPNADTDHDGGESAPGDDLTETDPEASPAATTETEAPAMSEPTTTPAAETAPAIDPKVLQEAVSAALAQQDEARRARKAEKRAAAEAATAAAARAAAESAAPGTGIPATAGASASETAEQRMARLEKLAEAKLTEAAKAAGLSVAETDEQILDRLIEAKLTPLRQAAAESGQGTARKGLLTDIAEGATGSGKLLENASADELARMAAASYPPPLAARR